jgi:hypothetical protein
MNTNLFYGPLISQRGAVSEPRGIYNPFVEISRLL